ncbi:MAG: PfkB family carbohydrate kinase, partial [Spirochaetaceae bacterium]|nr:PfkB family carbohydrate kinase [Spirochaetaceae bacterium]
LPLLQSYGVNTDNIIIYEGATGQAIIQLDKKKQNAIVLYPGGNGSITKEEITTVINKYHKGDLLVLQNEISHLKEVIEAGSSRGLKICLNPSPYTKTIEELPLHLIDIFFVNEIEGAAIAAMPVDAPPRDVLDKLVRRFPSAEIILTAGKDGAYYGYKEIREKGEIIDLPVVDTTGAGDTFTGYFLAARYRGYTVKKALDLACRASSIAISRKGAMESIPFAKEVFSSLKTADEK